MQEEIKNILDKYGICEGNSWALIIFLLIFGGNINNLLTKIEKNEINLVKEEMLNNE